MFEFTDRKTAVALVKYERDRNRVVYPEYIAANGVTLDNVGEHVAALQALAFPDFDPKTADDEAKYVRKTFGNRVRNGLNFHLGKRPEARQEAPEAPQGDEGTDEGAGAPVAAESAPATLTVADMSTAGLASLAEDVVRELAARANAGDSAAMSMLNTLGEAIAVADVRPIVDGSRQAVAA